jgi:hypothetical protein
MKVFPTCLFAPNDVHADIERRTISGGEAINGDEDVIATDGGGRVFVEFGDPFLDDPAAAKAWRAIDAYLDGGATAIIVPFCDARHQPTNGRVLTSHSDGTTFSDETEYAQGDAYGSVAAGAALRATTLQLDNLVLSEDLVGGEWLSIDHPTMRWRAYRIAEITAYDADAGTATVKIRPPLREAVTVGEAVDFADPRCTMRVEGGMPSPTSLGYASGEARFVEDFSGSYA